MSDFAAVSRKLGVAASQLAFGLGFSVGFMASAIRGAMEKEQQEVRERALLPRWELPPDLILSAIDGGFIRDMMRVVYEKAGMLDRWITDKEIAEWRAEAIRRINGEQGRQEEAHGSFQPRKEKWQSLEAGSTAGKAEAEGADQD